MSKRTLVIVESPTKAETIKRYLDKDFTVVASKGHVRDLPEDHIAIDFDHGFAPQYIISEGKESLIRDLRKKLKDSDELLLATDEDREGESISWHLVELLKPSVPYRRMVFHEITRAAIAQALKGGRDLDMNLVKAQEDRRIIDRLYGYEVSPVLWRKLSNKKLSGGRVQSVGLRFIVEKELERLNYKASQYYDIKADFGSFSATLESVAGQRVATSRDFDPVTGEFDNKSLILGPDDCEKILSWCAANPEYRVTSVVSKPSVSNPQPPFTTSTLQQAASSRLRLSSRETMRIAQSLFEHGFITYMRTDSVNLSQECINAARSQIVHEFGESYLNPSVRTFRNKSKNAQEAHEAIRPAGDSFRRPEETGLKGKELALYTLIWMRTLATQMASARKNTTTVKIGNGDYLFGASGTAVIFPGYLRVYRDDQADEDEQESLPQLKEGDVFSSASLSANEHITSAPGRYSEASLIKKLEEQGIGRPSTYASIISTLLDRGYVRQQERMMVPTFTGFAVNACMMHAFSQLVDYSYTSRMEDELDRIANGQLDSLDYLNRFYYGSGDSQGLKAMVEQARSSQDDYKTLSFPNFSGRATLADGRQCSYTVKIGPYGAYLATDLKKEDGKDILVNIPAYELPGMMSDDDMSRLISDAVCGSQTASGDTIVLKKGQWGEYWQKGDKVTTVPRGRKKASDYTEAEIEYMLSLPRVVAADSDGNDIVLNKGPYGFYLKYKDVSYKLYSLPLDMTEEQALEVVGRAKSGTPALAEFPDYEGKSLSIRKGKFGPYLKWGSENIRLPKREAETFSESEVHEIIAQHIGKASRSGENVSIGSLDGSAVQLCTGRYGSYLKWNNTNYSIPRSQTTVDYDTAVSIIREASKTKEPSTLGSLDGQDIQLLNGRYGWYLKYNGRNYRIPRRPDADRLTCDEAVSLIRAQDEQRAIKPVELGSYDGSEIVVSHGRYGWYLRHGRENIALPAKYRENPEGLTLEEAVEIIKAKKA